MLTEGKKPILMKRIVKIGGRQFTKKTIAF
jgi:hypothetical protein